MKTKLVYRLLLALFGVAGISNVSNAQTCDASGTPLFLPCGGGTVDLSAIGTSTTPVFGDDFNSGTVAAGWAATPAADFSNPCGAPVDGTTYLWMGSTTAAPRAMTTAAVDVSCGGTVCFDFKFTCELCGDSAPCEGADFYNEGVSLQFSTDGGATYTDFAYFAPNGDILTAYPGGGVTAPTASGTTPFTTWGNYCFTIPAAGETGATIFRLRQWGSSGPGFDHWGIDNFYVYAEPCAPFYYDWDHIPGAPDSPDVTTTVTETTTFHVCYTNGTVSACDDVTVVVEEIDLTGITVGVEPCLGDDAGTASFTVVGGTGPYTYDLSGPTSATNATGSFTGLAPGIYTITISDATTCVVDSTFVIDPGPACCTVTATSEPTLCNGSSDGSATALPADGIPPYAYEWFDAGGTPIGVTTQVASGLPAGDYSVTITDAAGCTSTTTVTVTEPAPIAAGTTIVNASCFGVCDGTITIDGATGGTPGYMYNLNGGVFQVSNTFTGLCDGTYNIIVEDDNGCQLSIPGLVVTEPTDVTLVETSNTPATCGMANGELDVDAAGGTPGYTYDLGGTTNATGTFTGLASGTYTVVVTDANGCTEDVSVTIVDEAGPVPFVDVLNDVTCNGGLNGSVTIGVTGGLAPYLFSIDGLPDQPSNTFPAVAAGPHTVTVTDANGCTGTVDFVIGEPTPLTYSVVLSDASCNGVCDGEIAITASGATPPYLYSDDAGATFGPSSTLTGLCAGPVNVVVQDANGCLANSLETINEPTPVTATATHVEPSCNGLSDGEIDFNASGGTPGYTYSVDGGTTFDPADPALGIAAGTYDLVVQDANGCEFAFSHTVNEPPPFTFTYIANNPSNCGADDGSFEIIATDGLAPYDYSIDGGVTWFPDGLFDGLFSGLYTLVVEDANGCVDSVYEALSDNVMVSSTDFVIDATCHNGCDGILGVSQMFGAPPYTYTISSAPGAPQPFGTFTGLCEGTYYVTIEDDGLCIAIEEVYVGHPDTITFTPTTVDITCPSGSDGEIDFGAVTGGDGGPYTYSINGMAGPFVASPIFTGLTAGTYELYAQDGNGCFGSTTVTLNQPDPIVVDYLVLTNLLCNADNTGAIQVVADGGTPGYTYTVSGTTNATGIFFGLAAGAYTITMTDANGCTQDSTVTLTEPAPLTATYTITDVTCNGECNGEIDVDALGGTAPYMYSSDGGVITTGSDVLTGLCAGDYDVYVLDDNGCNITSVETVAEPPALTIDVTSVNATCGLDNGELTITAGGGTPGYLYSNDDGGTFVGTTTFTGLSAIDYDLVVQDANGCEIDLEYTIGADDLPVIDNVLTSDPLCNGGTDGTIEIISSGGVGAHQYSVGGPYQASGVFTGLGAGLYVVQVQDANGCITTMDVELVEPDPLTYAAVVTDLLCNGDMTGALALSASGGTAPYSYSITGAAPFSGGGTFSFIAAGNYDILIQDNHGCQVTGIETVNEPAVLDWASFVITDPTCFGDCDGTIATTITGGTAPYSYLWTGGLEDPADETMGIGACDGTYSVTVNDANGCDLDSLNFVITQPVPVPINDVITTDLLCFEDATGVIEIDAPTAVAYDLPGTAYTSGDISGIYTGLDAGNYDIVVTDADGCTSSTNTTLYEPNELTINMPSDWPTCYGYTVTVQAYVTGGTDPYSYSWTNSLDATVETTLSFDAVITEPVTYTLVVTDANGCVAGPDSYNVLPSPSLAVTAAAIPDAMICLGESVDLDADATGGQLIDFGTYFDYSYSWDTGVPGDTTEIITVSPTVPTDYTVTVTDFCGQVVDAIVSVGIHPQPVADVDGGGNGCVPELAEFSNPSFVPGYTCEWDFGDGNSATGENVSNLYLYAGCYDVTLTVTSDQGCVETADYDDLVCVYDNPKAGFYWTPNAPSLLEPTVEIINTAVNAETYEYDFAGIYVTSEENPIYTFPPVEEETDFEVCQTVVSTEGCRDSVCNTITVLEEIIFYVPNVFTPDGDDYNEVFKPMFTTGVDPFDYHLIIFNRWGEIVFESYNYDYGWDGTYGDRGLVEDGVYVWQVEFGEKNTDKKQTHRGHVTLLK